MTKKGQQTENPEMDDKQANFSQTCQRDGTKVNFRSASRDQLTVNNFFDHFVCFDEIALFVIFYKQNQLRNLSNKKSMDLFTFTIYSSYL